MFSGINRNLTKVFFLPFNNPDKVKNGSFQSSEIIQNYKRRAIIFKKLKKENFWQETCENF